MLKKRDTTWLLFQGICIWVPDTVEGLARAVVLRLWWPRGKAGEKFQKENFDTQAPSKYILLIFWTVHKFGNQIYPSQTL